MEKLGDLTVHLIKLNRYPDFISVTVQLAFQKFPTFLERFPWVCQGELRHLWSPCQSLKGVRHHSPPPAPSPASYTTTTQSRVADPHYFNGGLDPNPAFHSNVDPECE
jgi:hypothetical protein